MGSSFDNYSSDKRLTFSIYDELIKASSERDNQINKWAKSLNRYFAVNMWKMLKIFSSYKNTNQNYTETLFHSS